MPYEYKPGEPFESQGWKVKIRERERLEPPHASIIKGTKTWRWNLRTKEFMDDDPPERDVPRGLIDKLGEGHSELVEQWNAKYPRNKV